MFKDPVGMYNCTHIVLNFTFKHYLLFKDSTVLDFFWISSSSIFDFH